jgi:hypothetical protein
VVSTQSTTRYIGIFFFFFFFFVNIIFITRRVPICYGFGDYEAKNDLAIA